MPADLDRGRLAKLLGMLGSTANGEVLNAARAAERLRRKAGLSWPDILTPGNVMVNGILRAENTRLIEENRALKAQVTALRNVNPYIEENRALKEQIAELRSVNEYLDELVREIEPLPWTREEVLRSIAPWQQCLTEWERAFLRNVGQRRRKLSHNQSAILPDIADKVTFFRRQAAASV